MKLTEMVKLAGAGYKPAEIRELAEIAKENPEVMQLAEKYKLEEVKDLIALASEADAEGSKTPEPSEEDQDTGKSDREADLTKDIEELKEQLQKAREANTRKELKEPEDKTEEILADLCRSFSH